MKPRHIVFFILGCIACLALISLLFPDEGITIGDNRLRWPSLKEVLYDEPLPNCQSVDTGIYVPNEAADIVVCEPLVQEIPTQPSQPATTVPKAPVQTQSAEPAIEPILTDSDYTDSVFYACLAPFYEALRHTDSVAVRVVHYGDSQIEGDRITMNLRRHLQEICGGGGVGLIPLHQTIGMRTLSQSLKMDGVPQSVGEGPKRYLVYGPASNRRDNTTYGPLGQVAMMNDSLRHGSERMSLSIAPMGNEKYSERYFNRVRILYAGNLQISVNGQPAEGGYTHGTFHNRICTLPDSTTRCTVELTGQGEVYGLSVETDRGVQADNIPMRGCAGTVLTNISHNELTEYFQSVNARLIILQFGGNVVPYSHNTTDIRRYAERIRAQIRYLKTCAPEAAILFIGPSDMQTSLDGHKTTYPIIPIMDKILRRTAAEEQIAYWSLYEAMGGRNSMSSWQQRGWAGSDGIHFTRKGAEQTGEKLWLWLKDGLDRQTKE